MSDFKALLGHSVGRFEIVRLVGYGGMGAVYEAKHQTLPRRFAIKVLRPELSLDPSFEERFRREAIATSKIDHPNVPYITDFGETENGLVYLVMEFLEGEGLDRILVRSARLTTLRALHILIQIADVLDCAHGVQVVHRDLKPENILLTEVRGQADFVKVLDFGIAKLREPEFAKKALTMHGQVFGTAEYMSPEHAMGRDTDGRSDIYAVGCLAYELITGEPPFKGDAVEVLKAHIKVDPVPLSAKMRDVPLPSALDALVLRCLSKHAADRYQTAADLRRDLTRVRSLIFGRTTMSSAEGIVLSGSAQAQAAKLAAVTEDQRTRANTLDRSRERYHELLKELVLSLVQARLAPRSASERIERLLHVEEEIAALTGAIVLGEQHFDRIRFECGQKEERLRHAMHDLSVDHADVNERLTSAPSATPELHHQLKDLDYQIKVLAERLEEVRRERAERIANHDRELQQSVLLREEREKEAAELYGGLHAQVASSRKDVKDAQLLDLFKQLERYHTGLRESVLEATL